MEAHFLGVSLGAEVSGSVGGPTWAHDLEVSIGDTGIRVAGAAGTQASVLPWSAVRRFAPGFTLAFPDGRPATELEVALADRSLRFLVPADQLPPAVVTQLMQLAPAASPQSGLPAGIPAPPRAFLMPRALCLVTRRPRCRPSGPLSAGLQRDYRA